MTPERWKTIEEIFQEALDCTPAERENFVREKTAGDDNLRIEVEKLIARFEAEENFLESPVWTDSLLLQSKLKNQIASSLEESAPSQINESFIGRQIGVYRLVKELGKGGMGIVFLAERADGEFYQKVAIKLIKRGMDTDFIVRRFRHERQILANLNHSNIARLLDGGTTKDELPYFVMEFIEGSSFFKYCQEKDLSLRRKMELFLAVCSAISYAHARKIIHRDIKPGNILITDEGVPKLLDFGIAKILDPDLIHESISPTATQMRLMTPEYASPEQVRGDEITAASDQYSLGVLLYELITGVRPYKFLSRSPHEIARVICEEEPSQPSAEKSIETFTQDTSLLNNESFNKLDRIVLKALRKNPAERYTSVEEFAADIERFLKNETIRVEKFVDKEDVKPALSATSQKSIAVLPFKILNKVTGEQLESDAFLGIGLADALIIRLSNIQRLAVRPTSSVLRFNLDETDLSAVGRELNITHILNGNILRADKRIRISVQLLNVAEQSTVWAERFEEDLDDVLELEDSISRKVAESLIPQLTASEIKVLSKRGTDNIKAYEAYLRGRFHFNNFTDEGFRQAIYFYREAVALDPDYALAYAGIADYYNWLGMLNFLPSAKCYPHAKEAALRAIEIDDKLSEAYSALGLARLYGEYNWRQSERDLRWAIELNPNNSVAHNWYSHNLYTQEKVEEGLKYSRRALELDPLSFQNHNSFAWGLYFARRSDEALQIADEIGEKFPNSGYSYFAKTCFLTFQGKTEEALKASEKMLELSADNLFFYGRAQALAAAGNRTEALKIIENSKKQSNNTYISNYHAAVICCYLGDKEKAFEYLERSLAIHEGMLIWSRIEPSLNILREDFRYQIFLEKLSANVRAETLKQFQISTAETFDQTNSQLRKVKKPLIYSLIAIFLIVFCYVFYHIVSHTTIDVSTSSEAHEKRWRNNFASTMSLQQLTNSGKERQAALSPDGTKVAYVSENFSQQSLWLRSADGRDARQILTPDEVVYSEFRFSPDGKYIYYIVSRAPARSLYRVSLSGGAPEKLSENVLNLFAISPDGRRIAFDNRNPENNQNRLFLAELDEKSGIKNEQMLFALEMPNYFPGGLTFSPDGTKIIYPRSMITESKEINNLFVYDLENKTNEKFITQDFDRISSVAWRASGEEVVFSARENYSAPHQLWLAVYPSGEITRLTNDFTNYYGVSLSSDSSALVTTKINAVTNIWTSELASSNQNLEPKTNQITNAFDRQDGLDGVNWTKDGRILYIAAAGGKSEIALINPDGTNNRVLSTKAVNPKFPSVTSDNRYLIYADNRGQEVNIWQTDINSGTTIQISSRYAVTPALTPDNLSIVYSTFLNANGNKLAIHRKTFGSNEEIALTNSMSVRPVVSPDGRFVACNYAGPETNGIWQIAVLPMMNDAAPRFLKPYTKSFFRRPLERPFGWSPDGKFIYFLNNANDIANIFRISVEDDALPVQMTKLSSGEIFDFAVSPDGRQAVLARGSMLSDVVIFRKN